MESLKEVSPTEAGLTSNMVAVINKGNDLFAELQANSKEIEGTAGDNETPAKLPDEMISNEAPTNEVVACSLSNTLINNELSDNTTTTAQLEQIIEDEIDLNELESDPNKIPKFPIWGLPQLLQDMITEVAIVYGVPEDFIAVNILTAIAAVTRKKIYYKDKYLNYPQIWCMVVSPSGIGKSEPLKIAFFPLEKLDSEFYKQFLEDLKVWETECASIQSQNKHNKKDKQPEPPRPICQHNLIEDTTPEALYKALFENNGLTLYRDELAGWFADIGRYSKNGEIEHYLSIFNNKQIRINRKSEDPILIDDPCLSIIGTIQPDVLAKYIRNEKMTDNGFIQRFLFAYPDNAEKAYPNNKVLNPELLSQYEAFIADLAKYDTFGSPIMSDKAKEVLLQFRFNNTDRDRATQDEYLKSIYSKMEIHIIRLALIVHVAQLMSGTGEAEISGETMRYCVDLCHYFIATGEKVHQLTCEPQNKANMMGEADLIRLINEKIGIVNQSKFAQSIGKKQQLVNRYLSKK